MVVTNCTVASGAATGGMGGAGGTGPQNGPGVGGSGGLGAGAGLYNATNAFATLLASTFNNNTAEGGTNAGGAPFNGFDGGTGTKATNGQGGGVCNLGSNVIVNCTFFRNTGMGGIGGQGGNAPAHYGGAGGPGGNGYGGSLFNGGFAGVSNCTMAAGQVLGGAGGAGGTNGGVPYVNGPRGTNGLGFGANIVNLGGSLNLKDTILAYGTNANASNVFGTITDQGFNLSSDATPVFGPNSRTNLDPLLGPLAMNGGPTMTLALPTNSPAVNAGDPAFTPPPATDQRGFPRVAGGHIDIGAYELGPSIILLTTSVSAGASGQIQLQVQDPSGTSFSLWATTDFVNWTSITTVSPASPGTYIIVDPNAGAYPTRFYEVRSP
jgi:hypothetical protein